MNSPQHILILAGTRPEVIKQAPLARAAASRQGWKTSFVSTGQHRELGGQMMADLNIQVERTLDLMIPGQSPTDFLSVALNAIAKISAELKPTWIAVQGDTTTALAGALAGFYARIPVVHVEAGLRTGNLSLPFPEEGHRQLISRVTSAHAAPTDEAAGFLKRESIAANRILVCGNTGIDSLMVTTKRLAQTEQRPEGIPDFTESDHRKLVFVTIHRRESFGPQLRGMCSALARIAVAFPEVNFVLPVHPNPAVTEVVRSTLSELNNFYLVDPLPYSSCVWLMMRAAFLVTDSGGIQEEGPALGKPVLVLRDTTERPEAVACGSAILVGCAESKIYSVLSRFLSDPSSWLSMTKPRFPYGDGQAAPRILKWLETFGPDGRPPPSGRDARVDD